MEFVFLMRKGLEGGGKGNNGDLKREYKRHGNPFASANKWKEDGILMDAADSCKLSAITRRQKTRIGFKF